MNRGQTPKTSARRPPRGRREGEGGKGRLSRHEKGKALAGGRGAAGVPPLEELEQRLGLSFPDRGLLLEALTHSSYANEQDPRPNSNERLEFLGDSVIGLSAGHLLYERFPEEPEGSLARMRASLVSEDALSKCARALQLGRFVLLGAGEERSGGRERPALLCDLFEAVVGAIYLTHGWEEANRFVRRQLEPLLHERRQGSWLDAKSRLQEYLQQREGQLPQYRLVAVEGPPHRRIFRVEVLWRDQVLGEGQGGSRKQAEQEAAASALRALEQGGV